MNRNTPDGFEPSSHSAMFIILYLEFGIVTFVIHSLELEWICGFFTASVQQCYHAKPQGIYYFKKCTANDQNYFNHRVALFEVRI